MKVYIANDGANSDNLAVSDFGDGPAIIVYPGKTVPVEVPSEGLLIEARELESYGTISNRPPSFESYLSLFRGILEQLQDLPPTLSLDVLQCVKAEIIRRKDIDTRDAELKARQIDIEEHIERIGPSDFYKKVGQCKSA